MSKYSKINFIYFLQKWMDSVPGQTFLNYAYSWGASIVILGTLFKLTHLPGANLMLFLGMGTEVVVFFISAFDRPFDKTTIDMPLDIHVDDALIDHVASAPLAEPVVAGTMAQASTSGADAGFNPRVDTARPQVAYEQPQTSRAVPAPQAEACATPTAVPAGGTVIIGPDTPAEPLERGALSPRCEPPAPQPAPQVITPAPAVSQETAEAMEKTTTEYIDHLNQLNEMLEKVAAQSARLATDSEEMENLNRTLTGIATVYELQLKTVSRQVVTIEQIDEQTRRMAKQIEELNNIYAQMIKGMRDSRG